MEWAVSRGRIELTSPQPYHGATPTIERAPPPARDDDFQKVP
ncbi:MAG TPA: hypothetical protein VFZ14_12850 [Burkholderiales bacterium]|nr:hypothetical protein [Burkholderiales bacterium]